MSALGWGQALENAAQGLGSYLAARKQAEQDAETKRRFDEQMLLSQQNAADSRSDAAAGRALQEKQFAFGQDQYNTKLAAIDALAQDPKLAPYAPRIRATGQMFQTPDETTAAANAASAKEHEYKLEEIGKQGEIQKAVAHIQKLATDGNSPAARYMTTGMPNFQFAALAEQGQDAIDMGLQAAQTWLQMKATEARKLFPTDPLWGAPKAPGAGGSLEQRLHDFMNGQKPAAPTAPRVTPPGTVRTK